MATALLRSVILPYSSSSDSSAALLPRVVPSPTVVSVGRGPFSLSEFSGLRIHAYSSPALASLNSRTSRFFCRGGRILCEARETALGSNSNVLPLESRLKGSKINEATGPVLVEFWAPWCGPCRMIHPVIAELSEEYAGKLKCFKLNTDDNPSIATQYGIRSIPTIMIFINGEKKVAVIGAVPKTTLIASIEKFL